MAKKRGKDGVYQDAYRFSTPQWYYSIDGKTAGYWGSKEQAETCYIAALETHEKYRDMLAGKTDEQKRRIVFGV